jgi:hypothetical protein
VLDEQLGLAPHREPQVILELGEPLTIPRDRLERPELQPLAAELGSFSMRRTSAARTTGLRSVPASAARRRRSSGMLDQRKYEIRVASSCCEIRCDVAVGASGRSRSIRKRKSGETSNAEMPTTSPSSKDCSSCCASRTRDTYWSISAAETGRLNARRARLVMMRRAQAG